MNNNQTECLKKNKKSNFFPETIDSPWANLYSKTFKKNDNIIFTTPRRFNKNLVELGFGSFINHKFRFNPSVLSILIKNKIVKEVRRSNNKLFSSYKYTNRLNLKEIYNFILNNTSKPTTNVAINPFNSSSKKEKVMLDSRFFKLNFTEQVDQKVIDYLNTKKRMPNINKVIHCLEFNSIIKQISYKEDGIIHSGISKLKNHLNSTSAANFWNEFLIKDVLSLYNDSYKPGEYSMSYDLQDSYTSSEPVNIQTSLGISNEEWESIKKNEVIKMIIKDEELSNILKDEYILVSNKKSIEEAAKKGYDEHKFNEIIKSINSNPSVHKANNERYYSYLVTMKKDILKNALRCKRDPNLKIFELDISMSQFNLLYAWIDYNGEICDWTYEMWMKKLNFSGTRDELKVYLYKNIFSKKISKKLCKLIKDEEFIEKHDKFIDEVLSHNTTVQWTLQKLESLIVTPLARKYKVLTRHDSFLIPEDRLHLVELIKKDMKEILPNATLVLKQFNILD